MAGDEENQPGGGERAPEDRPVAGIKAPVGFSTEGNVSANWKLFEQKWKNFAIISYLDKEPQSYQRALFLNSLTDDAFRLYNGFKFASTDENQTVDEIIDAFNAYAVGEASVTYERFVFHKIKQGELESVDTFIAALRVLIKTCEFCDTCVDSILRDQIVLGS